MPLTMRMFFLVGALAITSGCEHGEVPEHAGRVDIVVIDDRGAPVANVEGRVETVNRSGSAYSVGGRTGGDGRLLISGISAGRRFVEVVPPADHVATGNENRQAVEVIEGATVTATFRLQRRASGRVPDIAAGAGGQTIAAAHRVGPTGSVPGRVWSVRSRYRALMYELGSQ